jgi:lactoylglutathione lyase
MALKGCVVADLNQLAFDRIDLAVNGHSAPPTRQKRQPNPSPGTYHVVFLAQTLNTSKWFECPKFAMRDCLSPVPAYRMPMSKARKLLHTRYRLNDLERSIKFYTQVLGLEEVSRHKSPRGSELVFLRAPESEELIELCHFPGSGLVQVQPDLTHLAFEVDNLEEFGRHLAGLGLSYSDGPHFKPDGGGIAFVDAPEGYEIELIQMSRSGPVH